MKLKYLFCGLFLLGLSACNYLDIVPDEVVKEEDSKLRIWYGITFIHVILFFLPTERLVIMLIG